MLESVMNYCFIVAVNSGFGAGTACWYCFGFAVLLDAASWVQSSSESEENFSGRGDFYLGVNLGSDSIPPKLFWMRV